MNDMSVTRKANPAAEAQMLQQMAMADGLQSVDIKVEAKVVAPILSGGNTTVAMKVDEKNDPSTAVRTGNPVLDEPDESIANLADLERLIAELMLETDEKQLEETEKRIKSQLSEMRAAQERTLAKINESIKKCEEAAKAQKRNRIFGWIMTAISVIACALTCVATFGAATPLAIAACAFTVAGTALTLTNQILDATGAKDKHIEKRAEELRKENPSLSKAEAKAEAEKEWDLGFGIACAICAVGAISCGLASSLSQAGKKAMEAATKRLGQNALKVVQYLSLGTQTLGAVGGGVSAGIAWNSLNMMKELNEQQAETKELLKLLDKIEAAIEEEEDRLKELLVKLSNDMAGLIDILEAPIEANKRIAESFTQAI